MATLNSRTGKVNGPLWGHGAEDWADIQEGTLAPVFDRVLEKASVGQGTKYLDVGCGSGMAISKAEAKGAFAAGLDASQALLDIAGSRSPDAELHLGDLEDLPFDDKRFDVVTSFNSLQYAGNPLAALKEAKRVMCTQGTIAIVTWSPPEMMEVSSLIGAIKHLLPPAPPDAPGPFALSEAKSLRAFASAAGLLTMEIFDISAPWIYPDKDTGLRGLGSSGVAARAAANSSIEAVEDAHASALAPFRQIDGSYRIEASLRCLLARLP